MFVYRISKKRYIRDLSGIGAGLYGGRWNPKGVNLVYTSGTISLAYLEFLVHNYHILSTAELCMAKIEITLPGRVMTCNPEDLSERWDDKRGPSLETQEIGKRFIEDGKHYLLKVPSVIVPNEFNILMNPFHSNHSKTEIREIIDPLKYDSRLLKLKNQ